MTPGLDRWRLAAEHPLRAFARTAGRVGAVAAALAAVGAYLDPDQFLRSYLFAYVFWVQVALGCMALLMINHITGGAWGAAIRRGLESGARTIVPLGVLFLPIALGVGRLYEWARPEVVAHDVVLQHKAPYLNVPFFCARAGIYFVAWALLARYLARWSLAQDEDERAAPAAAFRLEQLSRGGLVVLGLTMTFASFDWVMSLEPHWYSSIFGVIFMGGAALSAFAVVIPVAVALADREPLRTTLGPGIFHDLGNLLLAFVMLWAYFNFSQLIIIWAGNLPEEIPWYIRRSQGGWQWVGIALAGLHFALPFCVLLSRDRKRHPRRLLVVALGLLAMRVVDVFWLVAPVFSAAGVTVHWLDPVTLVALGGLWFALFVRRLDGRALVPLNDASLPLEAAGEEAA
jgi:hypothetical protein